MAGWLVDHALDEAELLESHRLFLTVSATSIELHEGIKLVFQNCHRLAVFRNDQFDSTYQAFIFHCSQILSLSPELRD